MPLNRRALLGAIPFAAATPGAAWAQAFPDRPIRVIVPYAPGGNVDIVARLLAPGMQARLGQPVVVENRLGAGGAVGAEAVARARPDGYLLLAGSNGPLTVNPSLQASLPYDPLRDFAPIAMASRVPNALVARRDLPAQDLQGFVALSKSRPQGLNVASTGTGTVTHLTLERFRIATSGNFLHVPYRGGGQVGADVIAGTVDGAVFELNTALPLHRSGDIRILAVASAQRSPLLPDVPTFIESGVADFTAASFVGLLSSAGTPDAVLLTLRDAMAAALADETVRARITGSGGGISGGTEQQPAGFAAFIVAELARSRAAALAAGLRPA